MGDPQALLQKADKLVSSATGGFSFFGGKQTKYEDAAQAYIDAANGFRQNRDMTSAGAAFRRAAQVQQKNLSEPLDAANSLNEAFKCYRQTEPQQAASAMSDAIQIYTAQGNFRRAATNMQTLAELYETGLDDQTNALKSYETAANWFSDDNAEALANKLLLKAGEIAALIGETEGGNKDNYYKAIAHFEKVARASVDNNLMRWSVKDYLLKGFIAHLATGDVVGSSKALDEYRAMDPAFSQTRENMLCQDLLEAVEKQDPDVFSEKLFQFDQMSKLDKWKTTLLLRIKNSIEAAGDDFS